MKAPNLESERLIYRPLTIAHLSQQYVGWLNDNEVYMFLETGGNYSLQSLKTFLQEVELKDILFWAIHLKANDLHIGNIKLDPINAKHGTGELGVLIGEKREWGKGYAREACTTIIDYCFKNINLRKVTLGVVADNVGAVNLYKGLGFETEGHYKKHGLYGGKFCDILRMALFNPNCSCYDE